MARYVMCAQRGITGRPGLPSWIASDIARRLGVPVRHRTGRHRTGSAAGTASDGIRQGIGRGQREQQQAEGQRLQADPPAHEPGAVRPVEIAAAYHRRHAQPERHPCCKHREHHEQRKTVPLSPPRNTVIAQHHGTVEEPGIDPLQ